MRSLFKYLKYIYFSLLWFKSCLHVLHTIPVVFLFCLFTQSLFNVRMICLTKSKHKRSWYSKSHAEYSQQTSPSCTKKLVFSNHEQTSTMHAATTIEPHKNCLLFCVLCFVLQISLTSISFLITRNNFFFVFFN